MTTQDLQQFQRDAMTGKIEDSKNPAFLFQTIHTDLLVKILAGDIDAKMVAEYELANRGLNRDGKYVGFNQKKS